MRRRDFVRNSLLLAVSSSNCGVHVQAAEERHTVGFGFSLYGMKSLPIEDALRICSGIGFDCVELPAMSGWACDPDQLDQAARRRVKDLLRASKLRLTSLMENLDLLAEDSQPNLLRLRSAAELGLELAKDRPPLIETILGGRPDDWEKVKSRMAERLNEWAKVAEETQTRIAIKAHVGGAAHRPEHIRWLLDQVGSRWLKAVYDFSHFQLRGLTLNDSYRQLADECAFIHIKDGSGDAKKFQFALPGDGTIDYHGYFSLLRQAKYSGDVIVEVSGQLHSRPGYDPIASARQCYEKIAPAFSRAGLPRG